jgi:Tfp pilus assembly protein PilV
MTTKFLKLKGFSMVEALVAITVLTIGVVGPLSLLANSISNANYAKNQITAFFLAQEGQELVINARNNNRLADPSRVNPDPNSDENDQLYWLGHYGLRKCIPDAGAGSDVCYVDASADTLEFKPCDGNGKLACPNLKNLPEGFYGYSDDTTIKDSIFNRSIQIDPITDGSGTNPSYVNRARLTVKVTWQEKSLTRNFVLQSIIYR